MYVTQIRLELLSRSGTNQIVAYKVVSFIWIFAWVRVWLPSLCFHKLGLTGPCQTDVIVSGALNYVALADNLRLWVSKEKTFRNLDQKPQIKQADDPKFFIEIPETCTLGKCFLMYPISYYRYLVFILITMAQS